VTTLQTSSPQTQLELLSLWSNPLPHAHGDWCAAWPADLLTQASRVPAARRPITRALRAAVPLAPLSSLDGESAVPWAMGSKRELFGMADEAGWLLMRRWIVRAVARRDMQALIYFLGRPRYQASFETAPEFWNDSDAAPNPGYATPAPQLQAIFRTLGFHALNSAMAGRLDAFRGRLRLLLGAQAASPAMDDALPIDHDALLATLRGDVPATP
jgi:hypothetical protein